MSLQSKYVFGGEEDSQGNTLQHHGEMPKYYGVSYWKYYV